MQVFYLSSVFGLAKGVVSKKPNNTFTLHIELTAKGQTKIGKYLTQSGHAKRKDAVKSWNDLVNQNQLEIELISLLANGR